MLRRATLLFLVPAALLSAHVASGQTPGPTPDAFREPPPSISGSATSNVKFTPDRATVRISVQTRATSAATAASQNATKQNAVLSALRSLGLPNAQLSTTDYSVSPEYRYEQNKSPALIGYTVTNTILADVRDLKILGRVLDAALSNGANMVSSLDFYASNTDTARREAINAAVQKARAEADVAARAAGGALGTLISLNIDGGSPIPPPRPMMRMAASAQATDSTPVNPGEQTLTVSVSAQWHYVPAR
ncbi:MAG: SIMPL domain-containing protein [Gemmatimonadaceae bacterium]